MGTTDNSTWTRIQQSVREAEQLLNQKQYNMVLVRARQTLEFMVNCLGEKALIVDGNLADNIDQLFEGHWISQGTKDHYHRIRVLGNKALHEGNDSPYDANEAFQLLSQEANSFANILNGRQTNTSANRPVQRMPQSTGPRMVQPADSRAGQAAGARSGQAAGVRSGQTGGARSGQTAGARAGQAGGARPGQAAGTRAGQVGNARPGQSSGSRSGQTSGARSGQSGSSQRNPQRQPSRTGQSSSSNRSRRRPKKKGFDPYDLVKPGLILLVLVIIVIAVVSFLNRKDEKPKPTEPTTAESVTAETPESVPEEPTTEPPTEPAPVVYKTTASPRLNVRSEPSTTGSLLGTLAVGTVVDYVQAYNDEWAVIMFEGKQAYVSSQYLQAQEPATEPQSSSAESSTAAQ